MPLHANIEWNDASNELVLRETCMSGDTTDYDGETPKSQNSSGPTSLDTLEIPDYTPDFSQHFLPLPIPI